MADLMWMRAKEHGGRFSCPVLPVKTRGSVAWNRIEFTDPLWPWYWSKQTPVSRHHSLAVRSENQKSNIPSMRNHELGKSKKKTIENIPKLQNNTNNYWLSQVNSEWSQLSFCFILPLTKASSIQSHNSARSDTPDNDTYSLSSDLKVFEIITTNRYNFITNHWYADKVTGY